MERELSPPTCWPRVASAQEFSDMLTELGFTADGDGKIKLADFRAHPCWKNEG